MKGDPDFMRQVKDLRRQAFDAAIGVLTFEAEEAARHLVELATGAHDNGPVRLGAIRSLFSVTAEHFTIADIEERLSNLEMRSVSR